MVCAFCAQGIEKRLSKLPADAGGLRQPEQQGRRRASQGRPDARRGVSAARDQRGRLRRGQGRDAARNRSTRSAPQMQGRASDHAEGDELAEPRDAASGAPGPRLFASSGTLVCCALPALLVALGAGAALAVAGLRVPADRLAVGTQGGACSPLRGSPWVRPAGCSGATAARPCPTDPALRDACLRTRRLSARLFGASLLLLALGALVRFRAAAVVCRRLTPATGHAAGPPWHGGFDGIAGIRRRSGSRTTPRRHWRLSCWC